MSKVFSARAVTLAIALLLSSLMFISGVPAGAQEAEPTPSPASTEGEQAAPSESPSPTPADSPSPTVSPSEPATSPEPSPSESPTPSPSETSVESAEPVSGNTETSSTSSSAVAVPDPCDPYNGGIDCESIITTLVTTMAADPCSDKIDCDRIIYDVTATLEGLVQNPPDPCDPYSGGVDCGALVERLTAILDNPPDVCDPYNGGVDCAELIGAVTAMVDDLIASPPDPCDPYNGGVDCAELISRLTTIVDEVLANPPDPCDPYNGGVDCAAIIRTLTARLDEILQNPPDPCDPYNGGIDCQEVIDRVSQALAKDPCDPTTGGVDCNKLVADVLEVLTRDPCNPYDGGIDCQGIIDSIAAAIANVCPGGVAACANPYVDFVSSLVDDLYYDICGGDLSYCQARYVAVVEGLLNSVCSSTTSSGSQACVDMVSRIAADAIEEAYRTACPSDATSDACADRYVATVAAIVNGAVDTIYKAACGTATTSGCLKYYEEEVSAAVDQLLNAVCSSTTSSGSQACVDMVSRIAADAIEEAYRRACPSDATSDACADRYVATVAAIVNGAVDTIYKAACGTATTSECLADYEQGVSAAVDQLLNAVCSGSSTTSSGTEACLQTLNSAVDAVVRTACPDADVSGCAQVLTDELSALIDGVIDQILRVACPESSTDPAGFRSCGEAYVLAVSDVMTGLVQDLCPDLSCAEENKTLIVNTVSGLVRRVCPLGVTSCVGAEQIIAEILQEFIDTYCPALACANTKVQQLVRLLDEVVTQVCGPAGFLGCGTFFQEVAEHLVYVYCPDLSCGDAAGYLQAFIYEALTGTCPGGVDSCSDALLADCPAPPYVASSLEERIPPACGLQMIGESISDFDVAATVPALGYGVTAHATTSDGYSLFRIQTSVHGAVLLLYVGDEGVGSEVDPTFDPLLPPSPPETLVARAVSSSRVSLQWKDSSDDEDGFKVFRATDQDGPFHHVGTVGFDQEAFVVRDLTSETVYFFRVIAYNSAGNSGYSNTASAETLPPPPPPRAPSGVVVTAVSHRKMSVTWLDNASNETGYQIQRSDASGDAWAEVGVVNADSTSFVDDGLLPSTRYSYRVIAYNEGGYSSPSDPAGATTDQAPVAPAAPTDVVADASDTEVQLSWRDNSYDENGFEIRRSGSPGGPYEMVGEVPPGETDFTDGRLAPATAYYYVISAVGDGGSSSSAECSVMTASSSSPSAPPNPPDGLSARAVSGYEVELYWSDRSHDEESFVLERSFSRSGGYSEILRVGQNVTTVRDSTASSGTTYFYRVAALNAAGFSGYSNVASVSLGSSSQVDPAPPSAPTGLTAGAVSGSSVDLSWGDTSHSEDGFVVQRSGSSSGPFAAVATLNANTTHYLDGALNEGTTYHYRVYARNSSGSSGYSNVATATTHSASSSAPASPSDLTGARSAPDEVTLTWRDNSPNESVFHVERASANGSFVHLAMLGTDATRFVDYEAEDSFTYRYRVRASNSSGDSPSSNEAAVDASNGWGVDQPGYGDGGGGGDKRACGQAGRSLKGWKIYREGVNWTWRENSVPSYLKSDSGKVLDRLRQGGSNIGDVRTNCAGTGDFINHQLFEYIARDEQTSTSIDGDDGGPAECLRRDERNAVDFGPLPQRSVNGGATRTTYGVACTWDNADPPLEYSRVVESDIRINDDVEEVRFFVTNSLPASCSNRKDLEGLMTHERGHSAGLGHVSEDLYPDLTMSEGVDITCNRGARNLGKGDIRGLRKLYA